MRALIALLVLLLFAGLAFGADMNATGHDWLKYNYDEKVALVEEAYKKFGVSTSEWPADKIVKSMDTLYEFKAGKGLDTPCIDLISTMLGKAD